MLGKIASRFGLAMRYLLVLIVVSGSSAVGAVSISPSPSTTGSYTVNWGVTLGCTYTDVDGWVGIMECYTGYDSSGAGYVSGYSNSFSGKAPGTYTYQLVYEGYWVYYGVPELVTSSTESANVQVIPPDPPPPAWSLTDDQRRAYLKYYAPVIFKRANEDPPNPGIMSVIQGISPVLLFGLPAYFLTGYVDAGGSSANLGMDWITNFYFDGNQTFKDNKFYWKNFVDDFATSGAVNSISVHWNIRPTLYTAAIEFMDQGSKELVLIYHIYHAMDETSGSTSPPFGDKDESIHDWERVEVHLKNVAGSPGGNEQVLRTVITQHHRHLVSFGPDTAFVTNSTGKHLMVFQAEWSGRANLDEPHGNELRYLFEPWFAIAARMAANDDAEVHVQGENNPSNVHYVFVPEDSPATVATFSAWAINWWNTRFGSFSGRDNGDTVKWDMTRRITYELQDLADIFPTHTLANALQNQSWNDRHEWVRMSDPILSEDGVIEMQAGDHHLLTGSADSEEPYSIGSREGYPSKSWWWGCYGQNGTPGLGSAGDGFCGAALNGTNYDSRGNTRLSAAEPALNPTAGTHQQHDYYVHSTRYADSELDVGFYLVGDWYKPAKGGFDGRYVQLFDDRRPLLVSFDSPPDYCFAEWYPMNMYGVPMQIVVSGAKPPYVVNWNNGIDSWQSGVPHTEFLPYHSTFNVTVTAANGETKNFPDFYIYPVCNEGPY